MRFLFWEKRIGGGFILVTISFIVLFIGNKFHVLDYHSLRAEIYKEYEWINLTKRLIKFKF